MGQLVANYFTVNLQLLFAVYGNNLDRMGWDGMGWDGTGQDKIDR